MLLLLLLLLLLQGAKDQGLQCGFGLSSVGCAGFEVVLVQSCQWRHVKQPIS